MRESPGDVDGRRATPTALGVREHVLQTVRSESARPGFAARPKAHLAKLG